MVREVIDLQDISTEKIVAMVCVEDEYRGLMLGTMKFKSGKALIATILFSIGMLLFVYRLNLIYNQNNLTKGDSTYYFYYTGVVLQTAKNFGIIKALSLAATWPAAQYSVLHLFVAAILSPVLPLSTSMSVILNGIWYLLMAASLCLFFWDQTQSVTLSFLLPIPLLIAGPPLGDPYQGLADLHVNLLGYCLGISVICFLLRSDHLRKPGPAILAGLFLGLLLLGRAFSTALVGIAVAPIFLQGFFLGSRTERSKTLRGTILLGGTALLTAGWWLLPRLVDFLEYPFRYVGIPGGSLGVGSISETATIWAGVALSFFVYKYTNYPLALVLSWITGAQVASSRNIWPFIKRINWLYIWMGAAPLLILILMRSNYKYYGWPSFMGIYLSAVFPFKDEEPEIQPLKSPVFQAILCIALAYATFGFATHMYTLHEATYASKEGALQVAKAILHNANRTGNHGIETTVGFAYYGDLNQGTLADVFLFDVGCPISIPITPPDIRVPSSARCQNILMPEEIIQAPLLWDPAYAGDKVETVDQALDAISRQADYVIILAPEVWNTEPASYPKDWPAWIELSKRLYNQAAFHPITPTLTISPREQVIVLGRVVPRSASSLGRQSTGLALRTSMGDIDLSRVLTIYVRRPF